MRRALPILCLLSIACRSSASTTSPAPAAAPASATPAPASGDAPTREGSVAGVAGEQPLESLDKSEIREGVRAHLGEVRACYVRGLASDPGLTGRVIVGFTIGPGGDVIAVDAQSFMSPTTGPSVSECIVSTMRGWVFPAPRGGGSVVVSYPFNFTSSDPVVSLTGLVRGPQQPGQWFPVVGYGRNALVVEVLAEGAKTSAAGVAVTLVVRTRDGDEQRSAVTDGRGLVVFTGLPGTGTATVDLAPSVHSKPQPSEPVSLGSGALGTLIVQQGGQATAP